MVDSVNNEVISNNSRCHCNICTTLKQLVSLAVVYKTGMPAVTGSKHGTLGFKINGGGGQI